ncbi:MAG: RNA polymerase sigma factor, partial [Ardenticatenaceae bacterium]
NRALKGELGAFEALYARHSQSVFRTIQAVVRDRGAAEDLLQECFVRAYRNLHRVDQSVNSLAPWLHRIALNLSYNKVSRRSAFLPGLEVMASILASPRFAPDSQVERAEMKRAVWDAIEKLEDKYRLVVVLYYLQELSLREIADILDVPTGTIKSRLFYARQQLRSALVEDRRVAHLVAYGTS